MIRSNVKKDDQDIGTIVNFGRGTVAIHEALRGDEESVSGYMTFTEQKPHEINCGNSHVRYETVEEMENGGQVHLVFDNIESLEALMDSLDELHKNFIDAFDDASEKHESR